MNRPRNQRIPLILLLAGLLSISTQAQASTWMENVSVLVQVAGKSEGASHVFDSEDYQRMLLVLDDNPVAFLIDLGATSVFGIPRDSVRVLPEGTAEVGNVSGELLTTLEQKDGTLSFTSEERRIEIQPLPPLIGRTTLEKILELKPTYAVSAKLYKPDPTEVSALKAVTADTEIRVFFGTWCLMCKRMIPGLIKTIEMAANPKLHVVYTGVDEDLKEPEDEIRASSLSKTPSVIVIRAGRELGRIEEKCATTIEADLAAILTVKR